MSALELLLTRRREKANVLAHRFTRLSHVLDRAVLELRLGKAEGIIRAELHAKGVRI